ncbi:hypothetical protein [Agromyces humi]|uniref:hypothetical protein n=1 Tax=Agromyces humi TaxID=1766800 RepID=UPI001359E0C7|nr:hypothetical protein [Agromyces humi]
METFQEPLEWPYPVSAEFDWAEPIHPDLQVVLAELGDDDMRERVASHPSIVQRAARELLILGRPALVNLLRTNPEVPDVWLDVKPEKSAWAAARKSRPRKSRKGATRA